MLRLVRPLALPAVAACALALAAPLVIAPPAALAATADEIDARLQAALASPARSAESRARDASRHPQETLRFFGLEPGMQVLELWPGGGWYTEILAPFLAGDGKLTVTNYDPNGPQEEARYRYARALAERLAADADRFGAVEVLEIDPPERFDLGADGRFDLIVTFRNNHGWIRGGYHDQVYREAFRVLKPGGVFGVVQHRAPEGADVTVSAENGYVPEAYVIAAAERAGFELAARSELNANPRDTKDYPKGVWTLPPNFRLGDEDRARYEAIGESDRMTLRFVKPAPKE